MKVEIEIDESKIPAGYEISRIGHPKNGDMYWNPISDRVTSACGDIYRGVFVILQKKRKLRRLTVAEVDLNKEYRGYFTDADREITFSTVDHLTPGHLFGIRVGNTDHPFLNTTGGYYRYFWVIEE